MLVPHPLDIGIHNMAMQQQMIPVPFNGGSNLQRAAQSDSQYSLNWYSYYDPVTEEYALYPYMGYKKILTFDVGDPTFYGRAGGLISTEDEAFAVVGDKLFKLDTMITPELIDDINTSVGNVSMQLISDYMTFADSADQYTYNITTGDFAITSNPAGPLNPTSLCSVQNYILANNLDSQTCYQTTLNTPDGYFAFGNIQIDWLSSPQSYPLLNISAVNGAVFCFSTAFIQVLNNAKKAGFTFRPNESLIFGYGTVSGASVVKGVGGLPGKPQQEFLTFVSKYQGQFRVMMTNGNQPSPISTPSIDFRLSQMGAMIKDVIGNFISVNGQSFVEYSFTQANVTLVYNYSSQEWFDVSHLQKRNITQAYTYFNGRHLALSYNSASLYELSEDFYTQDDTPMLQVRVTRNFRIPGFKMVTGNLVKLWFQQGVGLPGNNVPGTKNYVYGSNPEVTFYSSFDGGVTYQTPQTGNLGPVGDTLYQTTFDCLGTSRDWTFKIAVQSPVKVFLLGVEFYYTPAESSR